MSQNIDKIVPVTFNIKRSGLGAVSFGVALVTFGNATDDADKGTLVFTDYNAVSKQHASRTELLSVAKAWFEAGGSTLITYGYEHTTIPDKPAVVQSDAPSGPQPTGLAAKLAAITAPPSTPTNLVPAMQAVADKHWFYFPFFTHTPALTETELKAAAQWCDGNSRFMFYISRDDKSKDPSSSDELGAKIIALGLRRCAVGFTKKTDAIGARVAGLLSRVNYLAPNSYMDAEYKSIGVAADDIGGTDILTLKTKGYFFNTEIASKASKTGSMLQNTVSTSTYSETISEVIATDSYLMNLQTALLNTVISQKNLPLTPDGQQLAISSANNFAERYIENGFLGQRQVNHPITKELVITRGYITTTVAEDVYKLSDAERGEHKLYPIEQYIYRAGSGWTVAATVNVW